MNLPIGGDSALLPEANHCRIHHIGFVVASIEGVAHSFAQSIFATWDGRIIHDPLQLVRIAFFKGHNPSDPLVELVEPHGFDSPVSSFLIRGGGPHHLCYEVNDLEKQLEFSRSLGGKMVKPPLPAAAFSGRRIAWIFTKNSLLLEFLER